MQINQTINQYHEILWDIRWSAGYSRVRVPVKGTRYWPTDLQVFSLTSGAVPRITRSVSSPRKPGFFSRSDHVGSWWTKWQWDRLLSKYFEFSLSVQFHSPM